MGKIDAGDFQIGDEVRYRRWDNDSGAWFAYKGYVVSLKYGWRNKLKKVLIYHRWKDGGSGGEWFDLENVWKV